VKGITLIFIFISTFSAFASNWVFDVGAGVGKGTFSHTSFNQDISVMQYQVSSSALYRAWGPLFAGAETRFEKINQMTDYAQAGSNIRGSMWSPISPVLLISISKLALRFSYQFFGDYKLSNKNVDDDEITWKKAKGLRFSLVLVDILPFGTYEFYFQKRKFKEQQLGESEVTSEFLVEPELTTFGVEYKIIF
tara:strand:+ start:163664 stop:164242 length:579 start_codon:yes stop_codon:yes gene_type:complete